MKSTTVNHTLVGSYAPDFELPGTDDQVHHLGRYLEKLRAVCVVYLSSQCPYVKLYIDRLKNIQTEFSPQGFTLIGLNASSNHHDEITENMKVMKSFSDQYQLNFPYLWDTTLDVTNSFGVGYTPTVFLIDNDSILRYKGQIDDHPQIDTGTGTDYLRNAIAALYSGQVIKIPETEEIGIPIIM